MEFYTRFNPPPSIGLKCDPHEGRTLQQFKDECDINLTVKKYGDPFEFERAMRVQNSIANQIHKPIYGDFTELPDLQQSMNIVREAERMFDDLPSAVRERFGNDPVKLMAFVQDEKNLDEAIKLGLAKKQPEKAVQAQSDPLPVTPEEATQNASESA